jgi:hypothetical protein
MNSSSSSCLLPLCRPSTPAVAIPGHRGRCFLHLRSSHHAVSSVSLCTALNPPGRSIGDCHGDGDAKVGTLHHARIVLVGPQHAGNVGSVCRAAANFGVFLPHTTHFCLKLFVHTLPHASIKHLYVYMLSAYVCMCVCVFSCFCIQILYLYICTIDAYICVYFSDKTV